MVDDHEMHSDEHKKNYIKVYRLIGMKYNLKTLKKLNGEMNYVNLLGKKKEIDRVNFEIKIKS